MNQIDFIGYSATHACDFVYDVPNGHSCYLLLLMTSSAELLIDNKMLQVPANSAILYTPGYRIYYRAFKEEYKNDWIRFHSDESFVEQFPLKNIPFSVSDPEYCHNLIKLLTWESSFASADSESIISHLLRVLFSKLYESSADNAANHHTHALIDLHKKIYNNPQLPWNISQMSEELHLSVSYLQTLYKKLFGSSCMDDVIEGRLRRAQDQLKYTSKSIQEIAESCGYNNVEHFCRQFRQHNGCTPGQYRKAATKNNEANPPSHFTLGGKEFLQTPN
ncbi:MAG: helix-turn-helix transcriptional regulator [Acetatifactor sp.]